MIVKDFLKDINNIKFKSTNSIIRNHFICKDGFKISIQASMMHYCWPKINLDNGEYECVEVACLPQEELEEFYLDKMDAIYIYEFVPIEEVENLINKHNDKVIH